MDIEITKSSPKEINLTLKGVDISTLYIVQHELLKNSEVDFAGVIIRHPLTNEIWVRVNLSKGNPVNAITEATNSAISYTSELKELFNSKIKVN